MSQPAVGITGHDDIPERAQPHLAAARAEQAAAAEILVLMQEGGHDEQPVLDAIVSSCARLIEDSRVSIWLVEGRELLRRARGGPGPEATTGQHITRLGLDRSSVLATSVLDSTLLHLPDASSAVERYPSLATVAIPEGFGSLLVTPLMRGGAAVGAIAVARPRVGAFSAREVQLLRTFAGEAVIAIANARLFRETRQALERQTATAEVLRVISASPTDVQPVLEAVAARAESLCDGGSAAVYLRSGEFLRRAAVHGRFTLLDASAADQPIDTRSTIGCAVLQGRTVAIADIAAERERYPLTWKSVERIARESGLSERHSMVAVPMMKDGAAIGGIVVRRTEVRPFSEQETTLLQTFADQAVIAIQNVRLFNEIQEKNKLLQRQAEELAQWNQTLEARVAEGIQAVERAGRLKRFLPPQIADLVLSGGADTMLRLHRREIVVVFLDLRGFTAFTETADPEEVMSVLNEYHASMGRLIQAHGGTLDGYAGDGIMIFFNDPIEIPDPALRAAGMAIEMQREFAPLADAWRVRGYDLGLGIGIAQGYATLGTIGFEGRWDYGAIGTVCNLAARLCGEAQGGEILISPRVVAALGGKMATESAGDLVLKGFARPVCASRLVECGPSA